jgi:hypothetical protein
MQRVERWKVSMRWVEMLVKTLGVAVALVVAGILVALSAGAYADLSHSTWMPSGRRIGFAAFTIVVFGLILHEFCLSWSRQAFWMIVVVLFVLHTLIYVAAFSSVAQRLRVIWFAIISIVECAVFAVVLDLLGYRRRRTR